MHLLFLLLLWSSATIAQSDSSLYYKITYIVDGDTFDGRNLVTGEKIRFRPIGMDTPETGKRDGNPEPFHRQATDYTSDILKDKTVRIEYDIQSQDRYDRDLVYVWLDDGRLFNQEILKAGWARVATYPPNVKYVDLFTAAQTEAREQGRGMWE